MIAKGGPKLTRAKGAASHAYLMTDRFDAADEPVGVVAFMLAALLREHVVDQTGLKEKYDITLNFAPVDATDSPLPSIFTAAEEQLGLKLVSPPYRRYNLIETVDVHNVLFTTTSNGVRHGKFEFAALVYDSDGNLVDSSSNHMSIDFPPDRFAAIQERGLRVGQTVEAPLKGEYFLRIGIYDANGDHVGAVEIPTSTLKPN